MQHPGNLFVVAAPSGAGKSSLVKALRSFDARVYPSVSHTTRAPRGQEKHGREYFFCSDTEFDSMIANNAFIEWANVHGKRYGTSKKGIHDRLVNGEDVLLEIDYQGVHSPAPPLPCFLVRIHRKRPIRYIEKEIFSSYLMCFLIYIMSDKRMSILPFDLHIRKKPSFTKIIIPLIK